MTDDTKPKTRRRTKKTDDVVVAETPVTAPKKAVRKPRKAAAPAVVEAVEEPVRHDVMAVLPLRNIVVFPHMIVPLFVVSKRKSAS